MPASLNRRQFLAGSAAALLVLRDLKPAARETPGRLARKDSFFGVHFDLHPAKEDTALGRDITDPMIERFLQRVKPDYVQYDCKGHPGYAGYPTKVGIPSPGIVKDSLEIWRNVTARHGVALYIHYSGIWDGVACEQHPEWAAVHADGSRDTQKTSTFGPYVDELLIPQLLEAAAKYDLDGAWVDGECWAVIPDYCPAARAAFTSATGLADPPKGPKDPGWRQFLDINRSQFRNYVRHYVEAIHARRPGFQIASNWLYSTFVPERPDLPVDFLSGDYLGNASISTARLEARYLAATGKPWDLMAWGFQNAGREFTHKPAVQLMQEASVVLAQGGGFQVYYQPSRGGHLEEPLIEVMGRLADFCRERKPFCHGTEPLPGIAVLFSGHSLYAGDSRLFGSWRGAANPARGIVDALIECHHSVDVVPDWRVDADLGKYRLLVVPDWPDTGTRARDSIVEYVRAGGSALIVGAENARLFAAVLGVELTGEASEQRAFIKGSEVPGNMGGLWQSVLPGNGRSVELRYPELDFTRAGACAATVADCGKGRVAAVYGPVGALSATYHSAANREFLDRVLRQIYKPQVEIQGPPTVEVALRKKDGRILLQLSNATAMQVAQEYAVNDFVPRLGPLPVSVELPQRPAAATLQPGGTVLDGRWSENRWTGTVPELHIHSTLCFSF